MGRPSGNDEAASPTALPPGPADPDVSDDLPYCIELRTLDGGSIEKILARAANAKLAQAIFKAAQAEYPGRRISLSRGARIVADSAE